LTENRRAFPSSIASNFKHGLPPLNTADLTYFLRLSGLLMARLITPALRETFAYLALLNLLNIDFSPYLGSHFFYFPIGSGQG
jgi:hypothetical protein